MADVKHFVCVHHKPRLGLDNIHDDDNDVMTYDSAVEAFDKVNGIAVQHRLSKIAVIQEIDGNRSILMDCEVSEAHDALDKMGYKRYS